MHALYLIVVCIRHEMTLLPAINLMILAYIIYILRSTFSFILLHPAPAGLNNFITFFLHHHHEGIKLK